MRVFWPFTPSKKSNILGCQTPKMVLTDLRNPKNVSKPEIFNKSRPQSNLKKLTNSTLYESSLQPSFIFYDFLIFDLPKRVKKISREGECADFSDLKSQFSRHLGNILHHFLNQS